VSKHRTRGVLRLRQVIGDWSTWWSKSTIRSASVCHPAFKKNTLLKKSSKASSCWPIRCLVLLDGELVRFTNKHPGARRRTSTPATVRVYRHRPDKKHLLFWPPDNDLESAAELIALAAYKETRGPVEHIQVDSSSTSEDQDPLSAAAKTGQNPLLCALIAYLLLVIHRKASGLQGRYGRSWESFECSCFNALY